MQTRANSVAWNPMEAFNFTAASEDCNLYSYDMRKLSSATCVHQVSCHFLRICCSCMAWHRAYNGCGRPILAVSQCKQMFCLKCIALLQAAGDVNQLVS